MTRLSHCLITKRARGFTLIEVLVSLFVLAVGLLGLALLQTTGLRLNTDSYSRTQATYAAYDIIDRMRASVKGLRSNSDVISTLSRYHIPATTNATTAIANYQACKASSCQCASSACSSTQLATYDLGQWYEQQDRSIPGARDAVAASGGGRATVNVANNAVTVTMFWVEQENQGIALRTQSWNVEIYR